MLLDLLHRHPRSALRVRLGAVAAVAAVVVGTMASCASNLPERLNLPFGDAQQLIVVTAPTWSSTSGSLTTYEKVDGRWQIVLAALPARVGLPEICESAPRRRLDHALEVQGWIKSSQDVFL